MSFLAHRTEIEGGDINHYPGSDEIQSISASFAARFGLMRLGIHHERIPPGRRVSWPHAEADEEEFVYVIEGEQDLWADGHIKRLKPDTGIAFPAGTGLAHTFINNTDKGVRLPVVGEASRRARPYPLPASSQTQPDATRRSPNSTRQSTPCARLVRMTTCRTR